MGGHRKLRGAHPRRSPSRPGDYRAKSRGRRPCRDYTQGLAPLRRPRAPEVVTRGFRPPTCTAGLVFALEHSNRAVAVAAATPRGILHKPRSRALSRSGELAAATAQVDAHTRPAHARLANRRRRTPPRPVSCRQQSALAPPRCRARPRGAVRIEAPKRGCDGRDEHRAGSNADPPLSQTARALGFPRAGHCSPSPLGNAGPPREEVVRGTGIGADPREIAALLFQRDATADERRITSSNALA